MERDKAVEDLRAAIWQYSGWTVLLATVFAAGTALGYLMWGDARGLREQVKTLNQQIHGVRSERENLTYEISRLQRVNQGLQKQLEETQAAPTPAAAPGETKD